MNIDMKWVKKIIVTLSGRFFTVRKKKNFMKGIYLLKWNGILLSNKIIIDIRHAKTHEKEIT